MSDSKAEVVSGKELTKLLIDALNSDNVDILKMRLQSTTLMVMAIMDTLDVSKVAVTRESLIVGDGSIESHYDFETDSYVVERVK